MDLKWQNFGRESLAIYNELHTQADLTIRKNGSVYIASNDEELQLIEELYEINRNNDYESVLLSKTTASRSLTVCVPITVKEVCSSLRNFQ
jgi:L-2-hydroxyglutarate oxidase LhgO